MGNVLCIVGSKIDEFTNYGYKLLGKRNGQKVYRRIVEEPIVRGFLYRTGYPDTFKFTEFAFVDDAGKVVSQSYRRVGTFGKATDATRKNVAEYMKYDSNFKPTKFHEVKTMPRPQKDTDSLFKVNEQNIKDGLFDQTVFEVAPTGSVTYAMRKTNTANPSGLAPLKGEYHYSNQFGENTARYEQELANTFTNDSKVVSQHTVEKAAKDLDKSVNVPYKWTIESLRNPNFYKDLTGPGEVHNYTQWHWS